MCFLLSLVYSCSKSQDAKNGKMSLGAILPVLMDRITGIISFRTWFYAPKNSFFRNVKACSPPIFMI